MSSKEIPICASDISASMDQGSKLTYPCECNLCGMKLSHQAHRDAHYRTHSVDKPYPCATCGKCFTRASSLALHSNLHTGEKPYCCKVCGMSFNHLSTLDAHSRRHTGERPYPCDICSKGFTTSSARNVHRRTHTGEKPYCCDVCGKGFVSSGARDAHTITHTVGTPHSCPICDKRFHLLTSLKRHLKKTHPGVTPNDGNGEVKGVTKCSLNEQHSKDQDEEATHACDNCGVKFKNAPSLENHLALNCGETPQPPGSSEATSSAGSRLVSDPPAEHGTTWRNDDRKIELQPCSVLPNDSLLRRYLEMKKVPLEDDQNVVHTAKFETERSSDVNQTSMEDHDIDIKDEPLRSDTECEDLRVQHNRDQDLTLKRESDFDLQSSLTAPVTSCFHRGTNSVVDPSSATPTFHSVMITLPTRATLSDGELADVPEQPHDFEIKLESGSDPLGGCTSPTTGFHCSSDTESISPTPISETEQTADPDPLDVKRETVLHISSGDKLSPNASSSRLLSSRSMNNPAVEGPKIRKFITCKICHLICASNVVLVDHFKNFHAAELKTCLKKSELHFYSLTTNTNQRPVPDVITLLVHYGMAQELEKQLLRVFPCPLCDEMYDSFSKVEDHIWKYHHVCRQCCLSFSTRPDLNLHRANHRAGRVSVYACNVCYLTVKHFSVCKLHVLCVHGDSSEWSSVECPMPRIQTNCRHRCPLCVEEFDSSSALPSHLNQHRRKPCTQCTNVTILKVGEAHDLVLCSVCDRRQQDFVFAVPLNSTNQDLACDK